MPHWQRCEHATDSQAEQSLEVGVQSADARRREHLATGFPEARRRVRRNGKGATAVVTRCGCRRGEFFEGYETRRGKGGAPAHRKRWGGAGAIETRRTPGSAAGCNKPATPRPERFGAKVRAEKAVEAVRNREDGTRCPGRQTWTRSRNGREVGPAGVDAREARRWRGTRNPGEEAESSARAIGSSSEGERRPRGDVHHRLRW